MCDGNNVIDRLKGVLQDLDGERGRLSILGRALSPDEAKRLSAVSDAAGSVRAAIQVLEAAC